MPSSRVAFGKPIAQHGVTQERIAEARCKIDMARLLTLKAAWMMDVAGNKAAKTEIAMIKVVAPNMACQVIDWAMQAHGGGGMCEDFPLANFYAGARTLRFADGPDEVHRNAIAKWSWARYGVCGRDRHPLPAVALAGSWLARRSPPCSASAEVSARPSIAFGTRVTRLEQPDAAASAAPAGVSPCAA